MYVGEESHRGVVPMSHSNNNGRALAENGEGRPLNEENTRPSYTPPTQSEARVSQGLAGVRKAAKQHQKMKFTALLHHLERFRLKCLHIGKRRCRSQTGIIAY